MSGFSFGASPLGSVEGWKPNYSYNAGDLLQYLGVTYIVLVDHKSAISFERLRSNYGIYTPAGGGGGTTLPADAAGVLKNNGSGGLTWEQLKLASHAGLIDASLGVAPNGTGYKSGSTWRVSVAGTIPGIGAVKVDDIIMSIADDATTGAGFFVYKSSSVPYVKDFVIADWVVGARYTLPITAAVHNKGTSPTVVIYENNGANKEQVIVENSFDATGNITISLDLLPDLRFNGRAIVS